MSTRTHGSLQSALVANIADARKKVAADAPEISVEQIFAGFKRELRSVSIEGFGAVYYYHPMSLAEATGIQEKATATGVTTASGVVHTVIALARKSDGSSKFTGADFQALMDAPDSAVLALFNAVAHEKLSAASIEKK